MTAILELCYDVLGYGFHGVPCKFKCFAGTICTGASGTGTGTDSGSNACPIASVARYIPGQRDCLEQAIGNPGQAIAAATTTQPQPCSSLPVPLASTASALKSARARMHLHATMAPDGMMAMGDGNDDDGCGDRGWANG